MDTYVEQYQAKHGGVILHTWTDVQGGKKSVSHLLHGLLTRFWDFITNILISFGIDTCAPL